MKKQLRKLLTWTCTAAIAAAALGGCSGGGQKEAQSTADNNGGTAAESPAAAAAESGDMEKIVLKGGCTYSLTSTSYGYAQAFAEKLKEVSGGMMELEWIGASSLGSTSQHYAQLKEGTLDFFSTAFDTTTVLQDGEDFAVCVVPYVFNSREHFRKFLDSDLLKGMTEKVETANNLKFLGSCALNLPRGLSTSKKPIYKPEDLKGLKIRTPESPSVTAVWQAWGANPVQISVSELFTSLEGGIADGQDNNILSMWSNSYYEVQDYYMELEYIQQAQVIWMSGSSWNKLNETQQKWLTEALALSEKENSADAQAQYDDTKKKLVDAGFEFVDFDREAFMKSAEEVARGMDGKLFTAGLYDQIKALDQ